jgi:hypothetical protein
MSILTETVNVDGSVFFAAPNDDFSSLLSLTYSETERKNLNLILSGFVSHNKAKIHELVQRIEDPADSLGELLPVHDRTDLLFLLERLKNKPRLVVSVFHFSRYENCVLQLQHAL